MTCYQSVEELFYVLRKAGNIISADRVAMQKFILLLNSVQTTHNKSDTAIYTSNVCTQPIKTHVTHLVFNAMFASICHFQDKMQPVGDHRIKVGETGAKIWSSTIRLFNNLKGNKETMIFCCYQNGT
jgi:hypothetical protein